jgi:DHA1 family bicyclomycin/chloramphenicol resistance-like MFS transporter
LKHISPTRLAFILAALGAITPLAIDMYLPSISEMSGFCGVDEAQVSVSISIFFLGLALGQLIGGPISDAYGRKPMVLAGLGLFCVASFGIMFVQEIHALWVMRFVQAFGGGVATVNVSATVRDMFSGPESARMFSMIGSITILAPLVAPALGFGLVAAFGHWQSVFALLVIYSALALYFYNRNIPYRIHAAPTSERRRVTPLKNYIAVLRSGRAMGLICALVILGSAFYAILTFSSVMYENYLGLPKIIFICCFALNISALMITSRLNMRLVRRHSPVTILKYGAAAQLIAACALIALAPTKNPALIVPIVAALVGTQGFVFGNALSLILDNFAHSAASANAVIGVLQYTVGACAGMAAGAFYDGTLTSMSTTVLICSTLGTVGIFWLFWGRKSL